MFKFAEYGTKEVIKRVVGLPRETIQIRDKIVYVNDTAVDESTYTQRIDTDLIDDTINPRAIASCTAYHVRFQIVGILNP